jgi:hypothetical protein
MLDQRAIADAVEMRVIDGCGLVGLGNRPAADFHRYERLLAQRRSQRHHLRGAGHADQRRPPGQGARHQNRLVTSKLKVRPFSRFWLVEGS